MKATEFTTPFSPRNIPFVWLVVPLLTYIILAEWLGLPLWNNPQYSYSSAPAYYRVQLMDYPAEKAKSVLCNVTLLHQHDSTGWHACKGNVKLYLQKDSCSFALQQGDILLVRTTLRQPAPRYADDFDYTRYLRLIGYSATAYAAADSWQRAEHQSLTGIRARAIQCRHALYLRFRQCELSERQLGVVSALLLGYTEDLDTSTRQTFTAAGAAHILAVSGMHTAIIYVVLLSIFTLFGVCPMLYNQQIRRQLTMWTIIFLLWFYAFLTGLTPSVLRSVLMITILLFGTCYYLPRNTYNTLAAAAFIELLIYPLHLFTVSFLLSYFAVLAILYFVPRFERFYEPKHKLTSWLWESIIVSFAAQIGTLPLTLYFFGQCSNYFVLTNIVVLLLSYIVMLLAVPALLLVTVPFLGSICAQLLRWATEAMIVSAEWIENIPHAITCWQLSPMMCVCLCAFIFALCLFFRREKIGWLIAAFASVVMLIGAYAWTLNEESKRQQIVNLSQHNDVLVICQTGRTATALTNDVVSTQSIVENFCRKHYITDVQIQNISEADKPAEAPQTVQARF